MIKDNIDNILWNEAIDNDGCKSYRLTTLGQILVVGLIVLLAAILACTIWTTPTLWS